MRIAVVSDAGFAAAAARAGHGVSDDDAAALDDAPFVTAAIAALGHDVAHVACGDDAASDLAVVADDAPDLVVNLCDSLQGDPPLAALVPAFLDANGVAHTGGDAFATALCKHKQHVKGALALAGLPTPRFQVIPFDPRRDDVVDGFSLALQPPVILKLCGEHASVGIDEGSVCFDVGAIRERARALLRQHRQAVLVEEFVGGREFYVSCVGRPLRALPLMEHTFTGLPLRTFDKKWRERDARDVDGRFAAPVPLRSPTVPFDGAIDDVLDVAARALDAVGWRDWGRVDLRLDKGGVPLIIDVTPLTYLHPQAPCPLAAAAAGLSYVDLWRVIVDGATS
jgi:D-alanine-D-alanine ligase